MSTKNETSNENFNATTHKTDVSGSASRKPNPYQLIWYSQGWSENRLHLGEKGLDIQEQKLIIDCITGLLNVAVQGGLTPMGKVGSIAKGGK